MKKCQPRSLTPYLDGELGADARLQVEEHLQGCPSCGALLDEVTSARERVRGMGRAVVPNTILMPALEAFRERGGIGRGRQLELADIPTTAAVAEAAPWGAAEADPGTEAEADPRQEPELLGRWEPATEAVEAIEPPTRASEFQPPQAVERVAEPAPQFPALPEMPPPSDYGDAYEAIVSEQAEPLVAEVPIAEPPVAEVPIAEPPVAEAPVTDALVAGAPVAEPPFAEAPVPEATRLETGATEGGAADASPLADDLVTASAGAAALEARPEAPIPSAPPPWLEAEAADAEDMEARGRRLIEEDIAADSTVAWPLAGQDPAYEMTDDAVVPPAPEPESPAFEAPTFEAPAFEAPAYEPPPFERLALDPPQFEAASTVPEAQPVVEPHSPGLPSGHDIEADVARMRRELEPGPDIEAPAALTAIPANPAPRSSALGEYREAIRARRERERPAGIGGLDPQVKLGLGAAAAVLLLVAALFVVPRVFTGRPAPVASSVTAPRTTASAAPSTAATPPPTAAPTSAPAGAVPTLAAFVTSGSTGSGFHVTRVRTGNPAASVYRIVFDLDAPGATLPDAQLGRAADGTLYLQSAGITVDPSVLASFAGAGPVTAITAGTAPGSLRLATSGQPQYSLYFLTGPNRLVIDLH